MFWCVYLFISFAAQYSIKWIFCNFYGIFLIDGHYVCFPFGTIPNYAAMKLLYMYVDRLYMHFYGHICRMELLGHEICLHLTLAYNTKQFPKWFCEFILYQPFIIVSSASLSQQHLALSFFLSLAVLVGRYYPLFVTLIRISVITTEV